MKQLFYFFEVANIRLFTLTPSFIFIANAFFSISVKKNFYLQVKCFVRAYPKKTIYQLDLVNPGINPKSTISLKVTRLTPNVRM